MITNEVEDKNSKNENGDTPFHVAAKLGNLEICQIILDVIKERFPMNKDGNTPFELAALQGTPLWNVWITERTRSNSGGTYFKNLQAKGSRKNQKRPDFHDGLFC